jgi:DNA-binding IclR family transcriptional regulator
VWAFVSRKPRSSLYDIARCLDMPVSTVHDALYALRDAGYIDFQPGARRSLTVLVPFIKEIRNGHR